MNAASDPTSTAPTAPAAPVPQPKIAETPSKRILMKALTHPVGSLFAGGIVGAAISLLFAWAGSQLPNAVTLERVFQEQKEQFADIEATLTNLSREASSPEVRKLVDALKSGIGQHEQFVARNQDDLRRYASEVTALRDQLRQEKGFSGGADFWLGAGESMRLAGDANVLAVTYAFGNRVDVNFNGDKQVLTIGDAVTYADGSQSCKAIVRQAAREDRRAGFDFVCIPSDSNV